MNLSLYEHMVNEKQFSNADLPIISTLLGIIIFWRFEQHKNAKSPIYFKESGISIC